MKRVELEHRIQQIIRTGNQQGLGRPAALTFVFLWLYRLNRIEKRQDEIATDSGSDPRAIRQHLSQLADAGWISYERNHHKSKTINLKKFRH